MYYQIENPHGGDVYGKPVELDYSANTNPLGTPEAVIAAAARALRLADRYPDPYCRELVKAIAVSEGVREERILCGNGASELIYAFCAASRPRKAAALAPTFSEYASSLALFGGETVLYPLKKEEGFLPEEAFLSWLEREGPEAVFLCNPNNPTGRLLSPGLLERIARLCRELGARLLLDECFLDLSSGGVSMRSRLEEFPNLLILRAFTKSYGMAGVRLGYGMTADSGLLKKMSQAVQPWNVSSLAQAAGIAALKETKFLEDTKALIKKERAYLKAQLESMGYFTIDSKTNYILFKAEPDLAEKLLIKGIAIRKCDNYHGLSCGFYRIAVKARKENEQLIAAIQNLRSGERK